MWARSQPESSAWTHGMQTRHTAQRVEKSDKQAQECTALTLAVHSTKRCHRSCANAVVALSRVWSGKVKVSLVSMLSDTQSMHWNALVCMTPHHTSSCNTKNWDGWMKYGRKGGVHSSHLDCCKFRRAHLPEPWVEEREETAKNWQGFGPLRWTRTDSPLQRAWMLLPC